MTLEQLLGRLEGVRRLQTGYSAKCPSHDDRVNSLSVNAGDGGRLLLYCHAGCTLEAILVALRLAGRDLFPAQEKPPRRRAVRRRVAYEIRAATGALVAVHERLEYDDGTKEFLWRREGKRGLGGLAVSELPLYGSEDVAAVAPGSLVVVTEGEKARDALAGRGIMAVGTVTGASGTPSPASLEVLVGKDVVLWPDADEPGRAHMQRIAERLVALSVRPRWLEWGGGEDGGAGRGRLQG